MIEFLIVLAVIAGYGLMIGITFGLAKRLELKGLLVKPEDMSIRDGVLAGFWPIGLPTLVGIVYATTTREERKELKRQRLADIVSRMEREVGL